MANYTYKQISTISNFFFTNTPASWDKFLSDASKNQTYPQDDVEEFFFQYLNMFTQLDLISLETGEYLGTIKFQDILEGRAIMPSLSLLETDSIQLHAPYEPEKSQELSDKVKRCLAGLEKYIAVLDAKIADMPDEYVMPVAPFNGKPNNTTCNGVVNHKPEWEGFWHETRNIRTILVYDENDRLTDQFYGGQNDFSEYFMRRANAGDKMRIKQIGEDFKPHLITEIKHLIYGDADWHFDSDDGITWNLVGVREF